MPTPFVIGIRFNRVGKIYHFDASKINDLRPGDQVVVETSRGIQLGEVATILTSIPQGEGNLKPVERRATPRDLLLRQLWKNKEPDVIAGSRRRVNELGLKGIKIQSTEYSYDGSRLTILFSSESEEKVELKSLRQDVQRMFQPAQVELRQIGPRDIAKMLGGMGACGMESRCCARFLTEFSSISIRMAKDQGISLTPEEITGMCGRLRCCLIYEYEMYAAARAQLPKRNKRVMTPDGEGKVVDVIPLREMVIVEIPELGQREYPKDQLQPLDELEALNRKAAAPCPSKNGEGCNVNVKSGGSKKT